MGVVLSSNDGRHLRSLSPNFSRNREKHLNKAISTFQIRLFNFDFIYEVPQNVNKSDEVLLDEVISSNKAYLTSQLKVIHLI